MTFITPETTGFKGVQHYISVGHTPYRQGHVFWHRILAGGLVVQLTSIKPFSLSCKQFISVFVCGRLGPFHTWPGSLDLFAEKNVIPVKNI